MSKLLIVMGVSGAGKSTIASALANTLEWTYSDADDFHSQQAREKMRRGLALDNSDRAPWLTRIFAALESDGGPFVLAYSGLLKEHRERFRDLNLDCRFLHLCIDSSTASQRIAMRENHFMPANLTASQFETLESTNAESDVLELDATQAPETIQLLSLGWLSKTTFLEGYDE